MYEKLAWDNFVKTGSIESFLEYRKISEINNNLNSNLNNIENINMNQNIDKNLNEIRNQNVGDFVNEIDKSERDCY